MGKKEITMSWEDFQKLGNPDNAPEEPKVQEESPDYSGAVVRVFLEKKGRGGKKVSIIRGLDQSKDSLKKMEKEIKSICGVGGSSKDGEIIIQGDNRDKIIKYLVGIGYKDVKKSGG